MPGRLQVVRQKYGMEAGPPGNARVELGQAAFSIRAERMRRHRERRRGGLRCLIIELRETEIDALARNGFLKTDACNDLRAIEMALYNFLNAPWVRP